MFTGLIVLLSFGKTVKGGGSSVEVMNSNHSPFPPLNSIKKFFLKLLLVSHVYDSKQYFKESHKGAIQYQNNRTIIKKSQFIQSLYTK